MTSDPPSQRGGQLRLVRRLRIGLVSAGVVGSIGVAGAVAATSDASGDTSPPSRQSGDDDESFSQWDEVAQPGEQQSDASGQSQSQGAPPDLQQGFGPSHASTGGS